MRSPHADNPENRQGCLVSGNTQVTGCFRGHCQQMEGGKQDQTGTQEKFILPPYMHW